MTLHHRIFGEGDPLIILHGLFGSSDNWNTLARRFAEHRQVILVDQRNHGRSFHAEEMDYSMMAIDLVALMDELGLEKADLLGHSMGGKTVLAMAMEYPDYISRLIVADIGPKQYESHHDSIFAAFHSVPLGELKSRTEAIGFMREFVQEEGVLQFLAKNLYWIEKGKLAWRMNLPVIEENIDKILASIGENEYEGETLFIRGGKSGYIQDEDLFDLHLQFPNCRVETMDEAGHWLHAEDPETFYSIVTDFLA
jgi:esterase